MLRTSSHARCILFHSVFRKNIIFKFVKQIYRKNSKHFLKKSNDKVTKPTSQPSNQWDHQRDNRANAINGEKVGERTKIQSGMT